MNQHSAPTSALGLWLEAARLRTLPAAVIPVATGITLAAIHGSTDLFIASVTLITAVLIQIGTNFANEYYDYLKGADTPERVGFLRATSAGLIAPETMKRATVGTMVLAFLIGLILVWHGGWIILAIGLLSLLFGYAYTGGPYPLAYNGLGDLFVMVFFGLVAVNGTYFLLSSTVSYPVIIASLSCGALATNILVVNNLRDTDTDRKVGKRTLGVLFGDNFLRLEYTVLLMVACAVPPHFYAQEGYSAAVFMPFLSLPLGLMALRSVWFDHDKRMLNGTLIRTAAFMTVYGFLLCIGLWFGQP
jgi:1,4-dihydroxy-2-naphthoate octaprenyltransferase